MAKEVQIIVSAKDMASHAFKDLGLAADVSLKKLDKVSKELQSIGKRMTTFITLPIIAAGTASVKMASDMEETRNKFRVAFGDMANEATRFADELADAMGRSRIQIYDFMSDAQAILAPMTRSREAAAAMSETLSALAVDIASYRNMADEDVFNRLISGLLGSTQATERLGVSLRQNVLELQAQKLGIEGNIATMDDATKILLRFMAIMDQTTDAQGDAIRTSDSFANELKALQANVSDLAIEIGQELLPYAIALIDWGDDILKLIKDLNPETKTTILRFAGIAAIAGPTFLAVSQLGKAIVLTGKALSWFSHIATTKTGIFILFGTALATIAMQFEEVQNAVESATSVLVERLGLQGIVDTVTDVRGLLNDLSNLTFDPEGSMDEAFKKLMDEYERNVAMLKDHIASGAFDVTTQTKDDVEAALYEILRNTPVFGDLDLQPYESGEQPLFRALGITEGAREEAIKALEGFTRDWKQMFAEAFAEADYQHAIGGLGFFEMQRLIEDVKLGGPLEKQLELLRELQVAFRALGLDSTSDLYQRLLSVIKDTNTALEEQQARYKDEDITRQAARIGHAMQSRINQLIEGEAFEVQVALALGDDFDSLQLQIDAVVSALAQLEELGFRPTEEEVMRLLSDLRDLRVEQIKQQAGLSGANSLLKNFSEGLKASGDGLSEFVGNLVESVKLNIGPRGIGFDLGSTFTSVVGYLGGIVGSFLSDLFTGADEHAKRLEEAGKRIQQAAEDWQQNLQRSQFYELLDIDPQGYIRQLEAERRALQASIDIMESSGWYQLTGSVWINDKATYEKQKQLIDEINKALADDPFSQLGEQIAEVLGVSVRNLQGDVRMAFSADNLADAIGGIGQALKTKVRDAMITAFLESEAMVGEFEALSSMIQDALRNGWENVTKEQIDQMKAQIEVIQGESSDFLEILDELGLGMNNLAETTRVTTSALRNLPAGIKVASMRYNAMDPVPMAAGGIVTRPTFAMVGEAGPEAVVPLSKLKGGGDTFNFYFYKEVYDRDTLKREIVRTVSEHKRGASINRRGIVGGY